jgi:S1-C subfamily serine protease
MRLLLAAAALSLAAHCARAAGPAPRDLARFVYPIVVHEGPAGRGAFHRGAGFFLPAGEFVTVLHLFQNLRPPVTVAIRVDDGGAVFECPIDSVRSYSRSLDFVIADVRLGSAKVRVPPIARSAAPGERIFGFLVETPGPVGPGAGPQAKAGIRTTEGVVVGVSPQRIEAKGREFLAEGSSGAPVFNAAGQALGIAQSIANGSDPQSRWIYVSIPLTRALAVPRLPAPLAFPDFLIRMGQAAPLR